MTNMQLRHFRNSLLQGDKERSTDLRALQYFLILRTSPPVVVVAALQNLFRLTEVHTTHSFIRGKGRL